MKYVIDTDVCAKEHVGLPVVLSVMLLQTGVDLQELKQDMLDEEVLVDHGGDLYVTQAWADKVARVLLLSDKEVPKEDRLDNLVTKLMEIFPKGKKTGTSVYWKGNRKDNKLKLQKFFKLYGNHYTDEQILKAAQQYVDSFNGNYTYMRALKYFIWKDDRKVDADGVGYIEEVSDLATYIENMDQVNTNTEDWNVEFR